jgi:ribose-phosphate pyrophosphokinase
LHAGQIQGFFDIPLDHLFAVNVFVDYFKTKKKLKNSVVVSPDVGGIKMARAYAKRLSAGLAIVDKRRKGPQETEAIHILGEVEGKHAIIVDDLISTGGSLIQAVDALKNQGAEEVYAAISHGVLVGDAIKNVEKCKALKQLVITDSIPLDDSKKHPKIKVLSIAALFAETIKRIHKEESVSSLFD